MLSRRLHRSRELLLSVPGPMGLLALAAASEIIWVTAFLLPFPLLRYYRIDTDMGTITGHSTAGFWMFMAAFVGLFVIFAAAVGLVWTMGSRKILWLVLGIGAVFGATLSFVYPITAVDVFTYVAQSRILLHYHQNPIFVVPAAYPRDPIMHLTDGWSGTGAPYGPIGILVDALPSVVGGGHLLLTLLLTKLFFSALTLAGAYIVWRILCPVSEKVAAASAVFVSWNPLVLFETSANGHNDIVMMVLLLLALESVAVDDLVAGTVLVVASALVKYGTVMLIPLFIVHALAHARRPLRYGAQTSLLCAGLVVVAYLPFWEGPETLARSLLENTFHFESFGSVLVAFAPIGIGPATTIGRVLYVPLYVYALYRARGDFADLVRSSFVALLGFLALATANFRIWYALWPNLVAATSSRTSTRLAAALLAFGATVSAAFYGYLWVWDNLRDFVVVNDVGYAVTFGPAVAVLLAPALVKWRARRTASAAGTPAPERGGA